MTCAVLWNENTEFLRLLVQSVRKDLMPTNEIHQYAYQLACTLHTQSSPPPPSHAEMCDKSCIVVLMCD